LHQIAGIDQVKRAVIDLFRLAIKVLEQLLDLNIFSFITKEKVPKKM
jgi:hypothetical protein